MAITDINLSGKVRADDGSAVEGAIVTIHHTAADLGGTLEATYSGNTDANGTWTFTETSLDVNYDVKISTSAGDQLRYIPWSDEITLKTVDTSVLKVRGASNTAAAPIYLFADLATDAGDAWRIQATDSDTLAIGSDKASAGTIIDYITITNGATAAASNTTILGQLTIGVNDTGADVKFFGATSGKYWLWDESADGVVQIGTLTVGVEDAGHDVKLFGATAGSYWLWDESADGVVQIGTLTVGVDDAGHDVKFFGNTASAYMLWDASADDLVLAGAAGIDLAGDIDVDGTANLDAVDIDGTVQIDGTVTVGVDGTGKDVKFFGDKSGAYLLWDESADKLLTAGGAVVDIVKDKLLIGGTAVTTTAAELNVLDAVTAGTVTASLGVVVDSNKDIGSFRNITLTGELDAATLDISGNADIDGTTNLDAVDIDGAVQLDATFTVGVDDTGYDVKFFGATSGQYLLWDESADELVLAGDTKLSFHDAAGGENIIASSDGHLEINAGTTLDVTATTLDMNGAMNVSGTLDAESYMALGNGSALDADMTLVIDRDFTANSGQDANSLLVRGEITAASGRDTYPVQFHGGAVTTSGSSSRVATVYIGEPNITIASGSLTNASTLYIAGAPDEATNNYALWFDAGVSRFDGNLTVDGDLDFTGAQEISTSSGDLTITPGSGTVIINQAGLDTPALEFVNTDIAHGHTDGSGGGVLASTNTFFNIKKYSDNGGVQMDAVTEENYARAFYFNGGASVNTDKDASADGAFVFNAFGWSSSGGTGGGTHFGSNGNIFVIEGNGDAKFLVDDDGDVYIDNGGGHADPYVQVYDAYDDAQLVRALDHIQDSRGIQGMIKEKWDEYVQYKEADLVDAGILGDTVENRGLLNVTGLQRLHNGAIWQGYVRQQNMQERLELLESKLEALTSGKQEGSS